VSVLLDASTGLDYTYRSHGKTQPTWEGIAAASFDMFIHGFFSSASPVRKFPKPALPQIEEASDDTRSYGTVRFASFPSGDPPSIDKEDSGGRLRPNELQKLKYLSDLFGPKSQFRPYVFSLVFKYSICSLVFQVQCSLETCVLLQCKMKKLVF